MTHVENIPHIVQHGITHSSSANSNPAFVPIGDGSLIDTRSNHILQNGRRLGEYIPFYFGVRTPMLYVVQNGFNLVAAVNPTNIIYCVTSVQKVIDLNLPFVFTDGHAVNGFTSQHSNDDINNIDNILDMKAIRAKYWNDENDLDLKRRKEAEFLVLGDIPFASIVGFVVYSDAVRMRLVEYGMGEAIGYVKPEYYF